ncbi:MAG: anaerobic ribonucleoside-triphosphate reductase activating protein [Bacteroidales bacterium]|nr:anaerobic ribonucleoside-triphosphate reductase activating protein [Bacteroidales bacterium]
MLRYVNTDVVFQEIPDEVTLAINLSGCPCRCPGCHSKYLWNEGGTVLDEDKVDELLDEQHRDVTCVSLMGGDAQPNEVNHLAANLRKRHPRLHIAWWSGRSLLSPMISLANFDYIKLGPYLKHLGPLKSPHTNQRLYRVVCGQMNDITSHFWKK